MTVGGAFWDDHNEDMKDPEYRKAWESMHSDNFREQLEEQARVLSRAIDLVKTDISERWMIDAKDENIYRAMSPDGKYILLDAQTALVGALTVLADAEPIWDVAEAQEPVEVPLCAYRYGDNHYCFMREDAPVHLLGAMATENGHAFQPDHPSVDKSREPSYFTFCTTCGGRIFMQGDGPWQHDQLKDHAPQPPTVYFDTGSGDDLVRIDPDERMELKVERPND